MRRSFVFALSILVFGCAQGEQRGSIQFALSHESFLSSSAVTHFKVRLFEGVPSDFRAQSAYFESPCQPFAGSFAINDVRAGSDYVLIYEGFSDDRCEVLSAFGVRGGIEFPQPGGEDSFYYVHVTEIGEVSAFPLPEQKENVSCEDDTICREQVHPIARCINGLCKILSLYPLNLKSDTAFGAGFDMGDGAQVLFGVNTQGEAGYEAKDSPEQTFDSSRALFGRDKPLFVANVALPAVAVYPSARIAVLLGGASFIKISALKDMIESGEIACPPAGCNVVPSSQAVSLNFRTSVLNRYTVPVATVGGEAVLVELGGGEKGVFFRAGYVLQDSGNKKSLVPHAGGILLKVGTDGTLSCITPLEGGQVQGVLACQGVEGSDKVPARGFMTSVCLQEKGEACEKFLILGGQAEGESLAELFDANDQKMVPLKNGQGVPKVLLGTKLLKIGELVWAFGGKTGPLGMPVMAFQVNGATLTRQDIVSGANLSDIVKKRLLHSATLLKDGKSVLILGGLNDATVLDDFLVLKVEGTSVTLVRQGKLNMPRAGHSAVLLQSGVLNGAVLVAGGLSTGLAEFAPGALLYLPEDFGK
jgi:hypothetical protein